jgi:hypothetical protein
MGTIVRPPEAAQQAADRDLVAPHRRIQYPEEATQEGTPWWGIALAGLLLAWPAALNGYPLVFADTGTYLNQAIRGYLGWDRPAFYSVFLHALHWRISLWPIVLAQGLMAAHLLALVLRVLGRPGAAALLAGAALLAVLTGLPWFVAQVMPDVFTGMLVLALWLLGFARDRLRTLELLYLGAFASGAVAVHLSHVPLAGGLAVTGAVLLWMLRGAAEAGRGLLRMGAPLLFGCLALLAANVAGHGRLSLSPFGSVFIAARLLDDGPALRTLQARCPEAGWRICAVLHRLPMSENFFLWQTDGPLVADLGGGKQWAPEAAAIVAETLRAEAATMARDAARNAVEQFATFGTGDGLNAWPGFPGPEPIIEQHFPRELDAYRSARQYRGGLAEDAEHLSPWHETAGWTGLLALPLVALFRRRNLRAVSLCVVVLAAAIGNAAITGALSGLNERYQGRIAWLFAFAPVAALLAARTPRDPTGLRHRA